MVLGFASSLPRDGVRVVESDQPLSVGAMQRKRVAQAMRSFRRCRDPQHNKTNPVATLRIHHENLPIEIEKQIEGWILRFAHQDELSY